MKSVGHRAAKPGSVLSAGTRYSMLNYKPCPSYKLDMQRPGRIVLILRGKLFKNSINGHVQTFLEVVSAFVKLLTDV